MESMPTENSEKALIDDMMSSVQGRSHETWRANRLKEDGTYDPRLKAVDPSRDKTWMEEHAELIVSEGDEQKIDIANLSFNDLPPSHKEDSLASLRYAFESVVRAARNGTEHNEAFIDATADTIHEQWIVRNRSRIEADIATLEQNGDEQSLADTERRRNQLLPYSKLATDQERQYDRNYVELALEEYRKRQQA